MDKCFSSLPSYVSLRFFEREWKRTKQKNGDETEGFVGKHKDDRQREKKRKEIDKDIKRDSENERK